MMAQEKKVRIFFDPKEHKYTDDEGNPYTSCTTVIGKYEPEYNSQYWAVYRALEQSGYKLVPFAEIESIRIVGPNRTHIDVHYVRAYEMILNGDIQTKRSPDSIQEEWNRLAEEACEIGSEKHDYLEDCINQFYGDNTSSNTYNEAKGFRFSIRTVAELDNSPLKKTDKDVYDLLVKYINHGFTLFAEKRIYSYIYKVSGTMDVLAVKGNNFVIIDWKTNKDDLKFTSGYYAKEWNAARTEKIKTKKWVATDTKMKPPINHLPHCKGTVYTLQLSIYAAMTERFGLKCLGLVLVHLRKVRNPGKSNKIYTIQYLKNDAISLLEHHANSMNNNAKGFSRKPII